MESSQKIWKDSLTKSYSEALPKSTPGSLGSMLNDMSKYSKEMKEGEKLKGGKADKKTLRDIAKKHTHPKGDFYTRIFYIDAMEKELESQLRKGIKVEMEHTKDKKQAQEIAMDHLWEDPKYYQKLKKIENSEATGSGSSGAYSGPLFGGEDEFIKKSDSETPKLDENLNIDQVEKVEATEATTSGSVGGYESPSMWAKSTNKKDWGPSRKTQYKGGSFVKVKNKCTKFPYCNQGDINALKLTKNESVKEAIKEVSKKLQISEELIQTILETEYVNSLKRSK